MSSENILLLQNNNQTKTKQIFNSARTLDFTQTNRKKQQTSKQTNKQKTNKKQTNKHKCSIEYGTVRFLFNVFHGFDILFTSI